jgi:hypothetical protein
MASNTDTLPSETGSVTQKTSPPRRSPPFRSRHTLVAWAAATVAACAAVATIAVAASTGDRDEAPEPTNRPALAHQAEQYVEWLESQAASVPAPEPTNRAALQHQIEQYVEWLESRAASIPAADQPTDGFVPGNLPALQHQAEQYVEWLESRAASISAGD